MRQTSRLRACSFQVIRILEELIRYFVRYLLCKAAHKSCNKAFDELSGLAGAKSLATLASGNQTTGI